MDFTILLMKDDEQCKDFYIRKPLNPEIHSSAMSWMFYQPFSKPLATARRLSCWISHAESNLSVAICPLGTCINPELCIWCQIKFMQMIHLYWNLMILYLSFFFFFNSLLVLVILLWAKVTDYPSILYRRHNLVLNNNDKQHDFIVLATPELYSECFFYMYYADC